MKQYQIGIHPECSAADSILLRALAELLPVRFRDCPLVADCEKVDAVISLSGKEEVCHQIARLGRRVFHVNRGTEPPGAGVGSQRISFRDHQRLDSRLRGRTVNCTVPHQPARLVQESSEDVLADCNGEPVWISRDGDGARIDVVSFPLPGLSDGQYPFDHLNGGHFIQLLPLFHFLKQCSGESGWKRPPLRACLMFDDPNLHWSSYGYLHYPKLVQLARRDRFHAALAMVPLDTWSADRRTVKLFKESQDYLSLLIHGNDHTRAELAQPRTPEGHLELLAQSLRRIARFEERSGLAVARVMAPPHGACSDAALTAMLALGFEGACISPWSLRAWNPSRRWPDTFGLEIAEMASGGFPVIPRFRLSESCEGDILVSALLDRPIIAVGHHDTLADGLEILSSVAGMVNSLGDVQWGSPEMMLRSNYLTRREGGTLRVRPLAGRITLTVPKDVTELVLSGASESGQPCPDRFLMVRKLKLDRPSSHLTVDEVIKVTSGETIELISCKAGTVNFRGVEPPTFSLWALPRRILCEGRDRLSPAFGKLR